ncbi:MAG: phytanoyl-CoA dioxygenase family protein [Gammaproteobacteria bacterium]|nr:phytanoyl-CoA dioxygenase family protein [Gammaproteobacteria bacterium]
MIDREHREIYDRDGVVRLEAAFDARWVTRLTQAFDRLQAFVRAGEPLPHSGSEGVRPADGDHDPHTGRAHLRNSAPHDADVRAWVQESPAAEIVARLLGSNRVQLWYDLWFCKEPGGGADAATPWHHDSVGHCFEGPDIPSLWIALTDVGHDDAPLLTLQGSHRDPRLFPPPYRPGKEHLPLAEGYTPIEVMHAEVAQQPERIRTWTVRAGDCLLIHPQTWHASMPQRSTNRRRLACTSRWLGERLTFQPRPYSFNGYYAQADALVAGARPPFDFLPGHKP